MKYIELTEDVYIPQIGFGTYKSVLEKDSRVIDTAIAAGYRHLDTANLYENEEEVGQAILRSGISRDEFFITSKKNNSSLGYEETRAEFARTLKNLRTDYLDLYLIHWPRPTWGTEGFDRWAQLDRETWRAMEELYSKGKIRAIGLSNFLPHHIDALLEEAQIEPMINQLELHPGYLQEEAVDFSRRMGMAIEAWSPMGRARLQNNPLLLEIAEKYRVSVPQLCLSFCLQEDFIILPKTTVPARMEENLHAGDLRISDSDMDLIRQMPMSGWSGEHPDREREEAMFD